MQKKSYIEMVRARNLKIARTVIRLKHSLAADEEINNWLPELGAEFDEGVQRGELKRLVSWEKMLEDV